jgi:hypothetical protein
MSIGDFFKRVLISVRERPSSTDLNALQSRISSTQQLMLRAAFAEAYASSPTLTYANAITGNAPSGFAAFSFYCIPDPAAAPYGLLLFPGYGVHRYGPADTTDYDGDSGADWTNGVSPLVLSDYQSGISVPSVPIAGHSRIDIIEVRADFDATDPATVGIYNPGTRVFDPTVRNKSFDWDLRNRTGSVTTPAVSTAPISYVIGVDHLGGISGAAEPPTSPGYVKIARINLDGAVASITQALIADLRRPLLPSALVRVSATVDVPGLAAGLGTEAVISTNLPQGVVVKFGFVNNVAPSAGESYALRFVVVGGDLRSPTALPVVTTSINDANRYASVVGVASSVFGATDVASWNGTDPNFTVINGTADFALGQPFVYGSVIIRSMSGALGNTERVSVVLDAAMS